MCCDHANFAKLLNVIEHQSGAVAAGQAADVVLGEGDWAGLEEHIAISPDPLFDCEVEEPLELLHRALLECDSM